MLFLFVISKANSFLEFAFFIMPHGLDFANAKSAKMSKEKSLDFSNPCDNCCVRDGRGGEANDAMTRQRKCEKPDP